MYFLIVLERIIWFYIFFLYGDFLDYNINFDDNVLDVCNILYFFIFFDFLKINIIKREKVYSIIWLVYDEVVRKGFEKNNNIFEKLENMDLWGNLLKEEKMKVLILNFFLYLFYCKFDELVSDELVDEEN